MPACDLVMLDDIEDIIKLEDLDREERLVTRKYVVPRPNIKRKSPKKEVQPVTDTVRTVERSRGSIIPGTQKIFVKTWGCTHNNSDSEYMTGQLASYGYKIIDDGELADLWLLNSCTVKNPSEDGFRNAINKAKNLGKHIVVAGCVPQGQPSSGFIKGLSVIGVQQIDRVIEVVEETLKGHTVRLFGQKKKSGKKTGGASLDLPKIRKNPSIEIIAINTGCLNQCTYCKTKHARGELGSYPPEEIVARAKQSFQEGVVELWITSEDTGAYGKDIGVTLPDLLWQLVEVIPEGAMLRLGMTNPPYILEHLEEVAKILNHPRVYSFLHVPVQSASNSVLMDMKREYCKEDFTYLVDFLKARVPGITIATDIICGFPTETPEDFKETYDLVEKYKFATLFINQFYPRPGTPAARMKRLPNSEAKNRTREIAELFHTYLPYEDKLGKRFKILITEDSKDGEHFVGHNKFYDQVLVKKEEGLMGKMVEVEIYETGKHFLKGKIMKNTEIKSPGLTNPLPKGEVSGADVNNINVCSEDKQSEQRMSIPQSSKSNWLRNTVLVLLCAVIVDLFLVLYRILSR